MMEQLGKENLLERLLERIYSMAESLSSYLSHSSERGEPRSSSVTTSTAPAPVPRAQRVYTGHNGRYVRAISADYPLAEVNDIVAELRDKWFCFDYTEADEDKIISLIEAFQNAADDRDDIYQPQFMVLIKRNSIDYSEVSGVAGAFADMAVVKQYNEETFEQKMISFERKEAEKPYHLENVATSAA
jgi:hypothetical protein